MSLKVWTAFKLKDPRRFWSMVTFIRQRGEAEVKLNLRKLYAEWCKGVDPKQEPYLKALQESLDNAHLIKQLGKRKLKGYADKVARLQVVNQAFRTGYRESEASPFKSIFDFNVSVTCREYKGGIYIIPYCGSGLRDALNFLSKDKRLRDYHYQNQVDRPKNVSAAEWEKRRQVWEPLTEPKRWLDFVTIEVCTWNGWYQVDPYFDLRLELSKEWKCDRRLGQEKN